MTGGSVKLRINGIVFEVPISPEYDKAISGMVSSVSEHASGYDFSGGTSAVHSLVDAVLGKGALIRISKGRRLDGFDIITLAVYICAKYIKAKESAA